jgi:hypothetical protein
MTVPSRKFLETQPINRPNSIWAVVERYNATTAKE